MNMRKGSAGNIIIFASPLLPVYLVVALKGALDSGSVSPVVGSVTAESATRPSFSPRQAVWTLLNARGAGRRRNELNFLKCVFSLLYATEQSPWAGRLVVNPAHALPLGQHGAPPVPGRVVFLSHRRSCSASENMLGVVVCGPDSQKGMQHSIMPASSSTAGPEWQRTSPSEA